jgi:uncharacterized protein YidB (DUF937 family)
MIVRLVRELESGPLKKAAGPPVILGIVELMFEGRGGFAGFLERCKSVCPSSEVDGWLGNAYSRPIDAGQAEVILNGSAAGIAATAEVETLAVLRAAALAIPKLVGLFTPEGDLPRRPPAWVPGHKFS